MWIELWIPETHEVGEREGGREREGEGRERGRPRQTRGGGGGGGERDRERRKVEERQTDRQRQRERETDRQRQTETERETDREGTWRRQRERGVGCEKKAQVEGYTSRGIHPVKLKRSPQDETREGGKAAGRGTGLEHAFNHKGSNQHEKETETEKHAGSDSATRHADRWKYDQLGSCGGGGVGGEGRGGNEI